MSQIKTITDTKIFIPEKQKNFVEFGYYEDLKMIISKRVFFPVYLYGLSGVGKTSFVKQICAELNYPLVRVNLTENTTEDHLFGGFRLVNGETVFYKGPVIQAMEHGALLLLDEGDQAPPTINMALQAILEGDSYLIKQTGEKVAPKEGFNIVLAANTKGRGDDTGSFIGAQIQNEANLDRYTITFEHTYPPEKIEKKIIQNEFVLNSLNPKSEFNENLIDSLIKWASQIRKTNSTIMSGDTISTRRLVHFSSVYSIFKDKYKTLDLILSRFDVETKTSWKDLFQKIDPIGECHKEDDYASYLAKKQAEAEAMQAKKGKEADWESAFFDISNGKTEDVKPW